MRNAIGVVIVVVIVIVIVFASLIIVASITITTTTSLAATKNRSLPACPVYGTVTYMMVSRRRVTAFCRLCHDCVVHMHLVCAVSGRQGDQTNRADGC